MLPFVLFVKFRLRCKSTAGAIAAVLVVLVVDEELVDVDDKVVLVLLDVDELVDVDVTVVFDEVEEFVDKF